MKSVLSKLAVILVGLLMVLCYSCTTTEQAATDTAGEPTAVEAKPVVVKPIERKPVAVEQKPKEQPVVEKAVEPSSVVAEIGDFVITRGELEKRLMREYLIDSDDYVVGIKPPAVETVLLEMIADKAMIIEGRKGNYLEGDSLLKRFHDEKLVTLLFQKHLQGKINVTDSEIDEAIKSNPKLDRNRAEVMLGASKSRELSEKFYNEIHEKRHVRKVRYNFPKAARIHQRLLYRPQKKERKGFWIKGWQIDEELTTEEKNIPLATFDGGKVTLKDWFDALHKLAPLKRPKDLNTVQGVEGLLDRAMRMPLLVAEAKSRGLHRDESFLKQVEAREDRILLRKIKRELRERAKDPTKEEITDYFKRHRMEFRNRDKLKIDQIWCQDLETARKVKDELSRGGAFNSVKQQYSLWKKDQPFDTSIRKEGIFFDDLREGKPGEIIGPVRGLYGNGIKWRIVKMLEKKPGRVKEYSSSVERDVRSRIRDKRRKAIMDEHRKELLEKYSYKIYTERFSDIDSFGIG
ncbi:MAG: peptidylprolyl isomerase [Planctomycetota bacterium]|jgi:hypothetical protein